MPCSATPQFSQLATESGYMLAGACVGRVSLIAQWFPWTMTMGPQLYERRIAPMADAADASG